MSESADQMAQRLSKLGAEFKAAGRFADATASLAGALAIHLDQMRTAATRQQPADRSAQVAAAKAAAALHAQA
jgi:hypothetical protein